MVLTQTAAALVVEGVCGYPDVVFRGLRHPVVWVGALIGALDRRMGRTRGGGGAGGGGRRGGGGAAAALQWRLRGAVGLAVLAVLSSTLLASRSLARHVADVAAGLRRGLAEGRGAVAHIVGRDPESLDEAGVARAAIESLAENFADGVVAPVFWGCVAGLPGMAVYKAVNTADSMIGHRTPRHERFGWAAARVDDLVNLPASRLAALALVCAALLVPGAQAHAAIRAVRRDAARHRSPNAGWPEAAMAGALGLRLAGPRRYVGAMVEDSWMGDGRAEAGPDDVDRALALFRVACALQVAVVAGLALLL